MNKNIVLAKQLVEISKQLLTASSSEEDSYIQEQIAELERASGKKLDTALRDRLVDMLRRGQEAIEKDEALIKRLGLDKSGKPKSK